MLTLLVKLYAPRLTSTFGYLLRFCRRTPFANSISVSESMNTVLSRPYVPGRDTTTFRRPPSSAFCRAAALAAGSASGRKPSELASTTTADAAKQTKFAARMTPPAFADIFMEQPPLSVL